ncbi:MAG TPA: hypothetical protein VFW86_00830, partial [Candidatus Limnocylindrales bacterium]|nr:hypothetical protein [Candidatus Limnocylindrales bacterium]
MKNPPPLRRPSTARPRDAATPEPDAPIEASGSDPTGPDGPAPPIPDELLAIERGLTTFAELAGARIEPAPELGVRLVTWPGRGLAFNHAVEPRWDADWRERADALAQRLGATGNLPSLATFEATASPPDLADRLIGAGWVEIGREQILWTRRAGGVPHLDPRMRIENVVPDRAAEYEAVEREIFGLLPSDAADRLTALRTAIEERRL